MRIVIDIPDAYMKGPKIENGSLVAKKILDAVYSGIQLPKGHGALVDYEELKNNAREYGAYAEATLSHIKPKIIIEADKGEQK